MRSGGGFNRRSFLIGASAAGGGLALGFAFPFESLRSAVSMQASVAPEITCWLTIARDDTVTIRVAHSEMGQGAMTGLAMLVAEELECD
jgi:isoquinoline 1-oxidoreductase beta subunit